MFFRTILMCKFRRFVALDWSPKLKADSSSVEEDIRPFSHSFVMLVSPSWPPLRLFQWRIQTFG